MVDDDDGGGGMMMQITATVTAEAKGATIKHSINTAPPILYTGSTWMALRLAFYDMSSLCDC